MRCATDAMRASAEYTKLAVTSSWRRSFASQLSVPFAETSSGECRVVI